MKISGTNGKEMSNLTQDFAEKVVAMFCPTTKVKITDGSDGIYLIKINEIHCGKDWSVSGLLHEIAHAKYYIEENKTGHDGRYADILTKITDEYMNSNIFYLYQDSKSKITQRLADDFLSASKELECTRKALEIAWDGLKKIGSGNIIEHSVVGHENDNKIFIANKALDESKTTLEQKDVK